MRTTEPVARGCRLGQGQPPGGHLVILHHTDCGIRRLTDYPEQLAAFFEIPAGELEGKSVADPYAAVRVDTAIARLHALLGGLHLSGAFFTPAIAPTVHALTELAPDLLAPGHCTGWRAQHALAAALPDSWIQSSSGTRYQLTAALPRLTRHRRTDPA
jgi:hypothetical protein